MKSAYDICRTRIDHKRYYTKTKNAMVNVIIYLEESHDSRKLVDFLLQKQLIAKATIDVNNVTYLARNQEIHTQINTVITAQTRSILFSQIEQLIDEMYGGTVPVYSLPITQANVQFDRFIRENTLKG